MGLLQLIILLILVWALIGGAFWVFPNTPDTGKRIIIAVGAFGSLLVVLSAFGLLPIEGIRIR